MDYADPPRYYDTFALRDAEGEDTVMQTWPYFRSRASRNAMKSNRPVPVASCWNGMGKLAAPPFMMLSSILFGVKAAESPADCVESPTVQPSVSMANLWALAIHPATFSHIFLCIYL